MHRLDQRIHLLLDAPRYLKVRGEARRRKVSVASVIREAIDRLPAEDDRRSIAIAEILAAEPMQVPLEPHDLRHELDADREGTA